MIKRILKITALVIAIAFIAIQFVQIDKTPIQVVQADTINSAVSVPADITQILGRSCSDCHSNQTVYPWYANVQPFGWYLQDHINDGRRELNFSVFNTYSPKKKAKKLEELCEQVNLGEMPLPSYLWIHRDAALTESDKKALCDWANQERAKIPVE
jgi:hypothetical protein